MSRAHLFIDESGNFDFSRGHGATRYFSLTAVTLGDCSGVYADLQQLRHQLAWEGIDHPGPFHANPDPGPVRQRVFQILAAHPFQVDCVILEKAKARPYVRETEERFYRYAWFYLMRYAVPRLAAREMLVVTASIGKKKKREAFYEVVRDVLKQIGRTTYQTACWDASADACLQVADYCGWAIQRKWETGDRSAYDQIAPKIRSEFDLWSRGTTLYY